MQRLNLREIEATLVRTKAQWPAIESAFRACGVGKKDVPFNDAVMCNMLLAYEFLDHLLAKGLDIFDADKLHHVCALNEMVHYGESSALRHEYNAAIVDNRDRFYRRIPAIRDWYQSKRSNATTAKVATKIYVSIIGIPQVFTEGNHRTGALIASWINVTDGAPPFVLSPENAVAFFCPSSEIKNSSALPYWRGGHKLPKHRKEFKEFWVAQTAVGERFLR